LRRKSSDERDLGQGTDKHNASDAAPACGVGEFRRRWIPPLGVLATVGLLTLAFAPLDQWYLAYVGLVPFVVSLTLCKGRAVTMLWAWLGGLAFWALSLYWLTWVTPWGVGYIATVLFLSLYFLPAAAFVRWAIRRGWPGWVALPVVWVALEFLRAHVISGFPWFFLAHTQYRRTLLIQIVDATGVYGVSFFVAMVNGLVVDGVLAWMRGRGRAIRRDRRVLVGGGVCLASLAGLVAYGGWRVSQYAEHTQPGPRVLVIQEAFPISLTERTATPDEIYAAHLASSRVALRRLQNRGVDIDLIVWPESVLTRGMNREFLTLDPNELSLRELRPMADRYYSPGDRKRADALIAPEVTDPNERKLRAYRKLLSFHVANVGHRVEGVAELSRQADTPVLAGGTSMHVNPAPLDDGDIWLSSNSAMLFDREAIPAEEYSKMNLVPFSEYVPFKRSWLGAHRALRWFVPEVMEQLEPGLEPTRFPLAAEEGTFRLVVPICYEGTFARVCRELVMDGSDKQADVLVNLSNDGWFVRKVDGRWQGSFEHAQHLTQYCFRAIETRVPVVRAVNTGVSASIDSCGRVLATVRRDGQITMVTGRMLLAEDSEWFAEKPGDVAAAQVLVDDRRTLYSVAGDWFALAVSAGFVVLIALLAIRPGRFRRSEVNA
jgi:apolipoprotein N-acyltransferase